MLKYAKSSKEKQTMRHIYIQNTAASIKGIMENSPEELKAILAWADETASGIICHRAHYEMEKCFIPVPFNDSIWNTVPDGINNGDQEWLYALNRHSILWNLAKAYAFTRKEKYKDTFIRMMTSYLDNTSYVPECLSTSWRSLETGIRPENWIRSIEIFDATGSPLPSQLTARMENALRDHIKQLLDTHRSFHRLSNWGIIQEHGLFIAGVALDDENAVSTAIARLEEELVNQTLEDGEDWEQSPLYHLEVLHSALDTILVARRLGIEIPETIEERSSMLSEALFEMTLPDSSIFPTGDSDELSCNDLLYLSAYLFSLPIKADKTEENWWDLGDEKADTGHLERKSVFHESSGNVFLRRGDMTLHMISGMMGSGHGHISPLHVDIAFKNKVIITDSGRYTYTTSPEREKLKGIKAHNTFIIDNVIPEKPIGSWGYDSIYGKIVTKAILGGEYEAAEGIYLGYLRNGLIAKRTVITITDSLAAVIDSILGDSERTHTYQSFWHIHPDAAIKDNGTIEYNDEIIEISSTATESSIERYMYSPAYNVMKEGSVLSMKAALPEMGSIITVISKGEKASISKLKTTLLDSGRELKENEASAFSIRRSDDEWIILHRSREITTQVDIMNAGFLNGYGRLLIIKKGDRFPTRLI